MKPDETILRTREDVMELLGLDEEGMRLAEQEREAHIRAWRLENGYEPGDPPSEQAEL